MTRTGKSSNGKYDAIIIGVGQAGNPLAHKLVKKGYHIAVIEKDLEGGSCVNYGCTPSKAMISSARVAYILKTSQQWGIHSSITDLDFEMICNRRDKIVKSSREKTTKFLENEDKLDFFRGTATFIGKKEIEISLSEGGKTKLSADKIFINTGTEPNINEVSGLSQLQFFHSRNWLDIRELPESMVIVGGGYIGMEMAQMFRRFGSKITVVERSDHVLPREDEDVADEVAGILKDENIEILTGARLDLVRKADNKYTEAVIKKGDEEIRKKITHLLFAAGTIPATKDLNLSAAGIKTDDEGYIKVNDTLETNVEGIYALGDCKGGPEFTHISYDDFRIVDDHLFGDGKRTVSDRYVPYTLFTDPELGRVGLNEKSARQAKISYRLATLDVAHIARAIETNQTKGRIKVLIGNDDQLLGAAVLSPEGGELMSMLQIAMMGGVTWKELRDAILAHPTLAESLNNLFMNVE